MHGGYIVWLIPSQLRSVCLAESADSTSVGNSQPDQQWWVTVSGTPTPRQPSWRGWKTRPWSQRLFGAAMSASYLLPHFEVWTQSSADFPAKTSVPQERAQGLLASGQGYGAGLLCQSFASYDHAECFWKTSALSLLGDSIRYSETWPPSGTMRNGRVYERPALAVAIVASEFSSWPTPRTLTEGAESAQRKKELGRVKGAGITGKRSGLWGTPTSRDWKDGACQGAAVPVNGLLGRQVLQAPIGPESSSSDPTSRRRLNPAFACWLMGWPTWWTHPEQINSGASEMALWRCAQQRQLDFYTSE